MSSRNPGEIVHLRLITGQKAARQPRISARMFKKKIPETNYTSEEREPNKN